MKVLLVAHYLLPHSGGIEALVDREAMMRADSKRAGSKESRRMKGRFAIGEDGMEPQGWQGDDVGG